MIFVTVGTHEQPFDRLVQAMDLLVKENKITADVFIQTGYSTYRPEHCQFKDFIGFDEMNAKMAEAEIVITHGGTGSVMLILYHGKIPVVVPRQHKHGEHIDDHQVLFCQTMENKKKIIPVYDTNELERIINKHKDLSAQLTEQKNTGDTSPALSFQERTGLFAEKLENICNQLLNCLY